MLDCSTDFFVIRCICQVPFKQHRPHTVQRKVVEENHVKDAASDFAFDTVARLNHSIVAHITLEVGTDMLEPTMLLQR